MPSGYFPVTPPAQCGPVGYNGCGCAGGAHFWNVDGSVFSYNYDHDNYDVGSWWDTDNNGETIEHNYYSGNFQEAVDIEISYNALVEDNSFVDNAWGAGACGAAAGNPCYTGGNLAPAVYISESAGPPIIAAHAVAEAWGDGLQRRGRPNPLLLPAVVGWRPGSGKEAFFAAMNARSGWLPSGHPSGKTSRFKYSCPTG